MPSFSGWRRAWGSNNLGAAKALLADPSSNEAIRLGKHSPTATRPRHVFIKFSSVQAKHAAFKKAKELRRQFKVSMDDDLTPRQKAARTSRLPQVQTLRGEGWTTFWRGDTLFKVKAGGAPLKVPVHASAASPPSTAAYAPPSSSPA